STTAAIDRALPPNRLKDPPDDPEASCPDQHERGEQTTHPRPLLRVGARWPTASSPPPGAAMVGAPIGRWGGHAPRRGRDQGARHLFRHGRRGDAWNLAEPTSVGGPRCRPDPSSCSSSDTPATGSRASPPKSRRASSTPGSSASLT